VGKIFRDRIMHETFVITRTAEEIKPFKALLNTIGANPCVFNSFEIMNYMKTCNIFQ